LAPDLYFVSANHAVEVTGGRMFGPGEQISEFDAGDEHNAQLLEDGLVTKYDAPAKHEAAHRAKKATDDSEKETGE
jgi:hypothetical protein